MGGDVPRDAVNPSWRLEGSIPAAHARGPSPPIPRLPFLAMRCWSRRSAASIYPFGSETRYVWFGCAVVSRVGCWHLLGGLGMFGWLKSPARESRQLNRDAAAIIDMAQGTYRSELQRDIALLTRQGLDQVAEICAGDVECGRREVDRFKTLHREARRQNNQVELTAYTLIIIHVRAQALAEASAPARECIEAFLDQWQHATQERGVLPG